MLKHPKSGREKGISFQKEEKQQPAKIVTKAEQERSKYESRKME